ncbi:hypothetical protein BSZ35_15710 [Salinibacter sp. 10B]|uniref:DUF1015 domain-containing protein n=1 Tax=Salinibacter sp. 10B TaxID=1923971 RepID=UPI000CF4DFD6|nr:DUF1015 family protein [Salinibacter sp. 10B]PQJ35851.1 hypothetical protein BSZ35_15710 [Salinibacter sp. 10B]
MATLHPFRAVRPRPEHLEEIASVPYDVVSTDEARDLADGKPRSFLHVARPEIDLDPGVDVHDDAVYEQGAANLREFVEADYTETDEPSVYVYRLIMDGREQTGIFGCVSVAEYDGDTIVKHEETRPAKEDDRTRHILTQRAHAEPVMLTYRDQEAIHSLVDRVQKTEPLYDFEAEDGVQHTIWKVAGAEGLVDAFREVEHLYIADGHHRCKAASRAAAQLREADDEALDETPGYEMFPAVIFPMSNMHIMAYNRLVYDLPESPADFLNWLDEQFEVERDIDDPVPSMKGVICLYLDGAWHRMALPPSKGVRVVDQLDVARLSEYVLEPHLDITDPRRDPNIDFVGGIRGTDELEQRVDSGEADLAVSMYPTSIEELVAVSDEGSLMPPKSTWFEPKLRSGLLVHDFADDVPEDAPVVPTE